MFKGQESIGIKINIIQLKCKGNKNDNIHTNKSHKINQVYRRTLTNIE